jgi:hypothetical protein
MSQQATATNPIFVISYSCNNIVEPRTSEVEATQGLQDMYLVVKSCVVVVKNICYCHERHSSFGELHEWNAWISYLAFEIMEGIGIWTEISNWHVLNPMQIYIPTVKYSLV